LEPKRRQIAPAAPSQSKNSGARLAGNMTRLFIGRNGEGFQMDWRAGEPVSH